ncbi:MAG: DUF192 domain-containing protein [Candidatus Micrarchaeota archaeon]|nr:DUF192 domain-containing protein [Candidatus Micrarchaeota archaeon]
MPVYHINKKRQKKVIFPFFEQTNRLTQFTGIMFRNKFSKPVLFAGNGRIAIHSFFCPLFEAIFLDKYKRIVDIRCVKPWNPLVVSNAFFLFEMPPGTVSKHSLKKGDKLQWTN